MKSMKNEIKEYRCNNTVFQQQRFKEQQHISQKTIARIYIITRSCIIDKSAMQMFAQ